MRKTLVSVLTKMAREDKEIMLLTGDLGFCLFEEYRDAFPGQFLNVGLSEQSMIGMAAGMALEGRKVFVYSIIPFLIYRALEQIRNDLCYQKCPVKLIGVGSGLLYGADGGTHHSIEDIGIVTSLPNIMVFAPGDPMEVEKIVEMSPGFELPCYIRLSRAGDPVIHSPDSIRDFTIGEPLRARGRGHDVAIFATGNALPLAAEVSDLLRADAIPNTVYSVHTLKPVHRDSFTGIINRSGCIVTIEEHVERNGLKAIIDDIIVGEGCPRNILSFNLSDRFIHESGSQAFLREAYGLTPAKMADEIKAVVRVRESGKKKQ